MLLIAQLLAMQAAGVKINPRHVDCLVKDRFPRIEAVIEPADGIAWARAYFRTPHETDFYFVDMTLVGGAFVAKLPRPTEAPGPILYYIEAFGSEGPARRTPQMSARIVTSAKGCPGGGLVAAEAFPGEVRIISTTDSTDKPKGFAGVSGVVRASPPDNVERAVTGKSLATLAPPVEEPEKGQQKRESPPKPKDEGKAPTGSGASESGSSAGEPGAKPGLLEQGYLIGPEDILRITVYGHEDLAQVVVVQADGTFTYPLIGRAKAADLTPKELEKTIALRLSQGFVRNPQVTVVVQEYRSKTVFVVGEVARPGTYPLSGSMTVVEMLARAGLTAGAGAEVIIVRPLTDVKGPLLPDEVTREGGDASRSKRQGEVIRVNIREIQTGRLEKNIVLRPNDTVFVSPAPRFYVSGEVRSPGAFPFTPGLTVRQAISIAGGLTPDASSGRLRVVREVNGKPKEMKISLDDTVQPADTVVVRAKRF